MGRDQRVGVISPHLCRVLDNSRPEQSSSFSDAVALSATAPDPVNDSRCLLPCQWVFWSHHLTPYGGLQSVCNSSPEWCEKATNGLGDVLAVRDCSPEFGVGTILSLVSFAHASVKEGNTNGLVDFVIHRRGGPTAVGVADLPTPQTEILGSDPQHQPDNVYLLSYSHPCRKSRAERHSCHRRSLCLYPAATIRPAPTPTSNAAAIIATVTTLCTSPTDETTSDVPSHSTITPNAPTSSNVNSVHTCPHCDRTFISHIGLVGQLRTHRVEGGEPVPGAPIYTLLARLNCPHCP
nr:unnamed protein product [Spirometra erinaceieuropaei]